MPCTSFTLCEHVSPTHLHLLEALTAMSLSHTQAGRQAHTQYLGPWARGKVMRDPNGLELQSLPLIAATLMHALACMPSPALS